MKKLLLITLLLSGCVGMFAQTGIGTDNPNASALLDLTATNKGLLPPRMTKAERDAIASPAKGLVVYCTDCNAESLYLNLGTPAVPNWRPCTTSTVANVTGFLHPTGILSLPADGTKNATGSYIDLPPGKWMVNVVMLINPASSANIWIRTSFSDSPSILDYSPDILGSKLISGSSINSSYGEVMGFTIIHNDSPIAKRYYHFAQADSGGTSALNFGGGGSGENQIFATPVN